MGPKQQLIERERRWAMPAAIAAMLAVVLIIASALVARDVSGDGAAELLRAAHEHQGVLTISMLLQALGFALLAVPLVYLFRAAAGRSPAVRGQLIGVVIVAPLFFSGFAIFNGLATLEAADAFVEQRAEPELTIREARADCATQRSDDAEAFREEFAGGAIAACVQRERADDAAENARAETSLAPLASGFGLGGVIGLSFSLVYTSLHAMRIGLLSRFWGTLGMALGVATIFFFPYNFLIWTLYTGLLIAGWIPGGRPPAWAAGEAVPWPAPGQEDSDDEASAEEPVAGSGREIGADEDRPPGNPARQRGERRKRKRRQ